MVTKCEYSLILRHVYQGLQSPDSNVTGGGGGKEMHRHHGTTLPDLGPYPHQRVIIVIVTSKNSYFRHGQTSNAEITGVRGLGHARGKPDGLNGLRANRTKLTCWCKYGFETSQMSWELLNVLWGE